MYNKSFRKKNQGGKKKRKQDRERVYFPILSRYFFLTLHHIRQHRINQCHVIISVVVGGGIRYHHRANGSFFFSFSFLARRVAFTVPLLRVIIPEIQVIELFVGVVDVLGSECRSVSLFVLLGRSSITEEEILPAVVIVLIIKLEAVDPSKGIIKIEIESSLRQQRSLGEQVLDVVLAVAVFPTHVDPEIVVPVEAVFAAIDEARDVPARFLRVALPSERCQSRGHGWLLFGFALRRLAQSETLSPLSFGVLEAQMRGPDVLLQGELAAVSLPAAVLAVPAFDLLRRREIRLAADEPLLAVVDGPDVNGQVALLGKAAVAAGDSAGEYLPFLEADVSVCDLEMTTEFSGRRACDGTVGASWRMGRSDVGLEKCVCGETDLRRSSRLRSGLTIASFLSLLGAFRATEALFGV